MMAFFDFFKDAILSFIFSKIGRQKYENSVKRGNVEAWKRGSVEWWDSEIVK